MSTTLTVDGMSCGGCEQTVEDALKGVDGVADATADNETNTVTVEGDADVDAMVEAITDAGYEVST